jgi:hypothetical protein
MLTNGKWLKRDKPLWGDVNLTAKKGKIVSHAKRNLQPWEESELDKKVGVTVFSREVVYP